IRKGITRADTGCSTRTTYESLLFPAHANQRTHVFVEAPNVLCIGRMIVGVGGKSRCSKLCAENLETNRHQFCRTVCQHNWEKRIDTAVVGCAETQAKLHVGCLTGSDSVSSRDGPLWSAAIACSLVVAP